MALKPPTNAVTVRAVLMAMALFASVESHGGEQQPTILIIGDSLYQNLSRTIAAELNGVAKVVFPTDKTGAARTSTNVLQNIDEILGKQSWDLIYISVGLNDLIHRAPSMQSFRIMPKSAGGIRATSPQQYEANLQAIVQRLKSTGSKVIWGNTTPTAHERRDIFDPESEVAYNAISEKIMKANAIPIIDMHAYVTGLLKDPKAGIGNSAFETGKVQIHPPIVAALAKELNLRIPEREPAADKKK